MREINLSDFKIKYRVSTFMFLTLTLNHFKLTLRLSHLKTNYLLLNWNSGKSSRQRMTKNMFFDWSILPSGVETMFLLSSICRVELGPFLVNLFSIDFFYLLYFLMDTVKTIWWTSKKIKEETVVFVLNKSCRFIKLVKC